jgi:hypothetical protein
VALSIPLRITHDILNIPMHHSPADARLVLTRLLGISGLDIMQMVPTPSWRGTIDSGLLSAIQELTANRTQLITPRCSLPWPLLSTSALHGKLLCAP